MAEAGKGRLPGDPGLSSAPPGISPASPSVPPPNLVGIDDFQKLQFRVGKIVSAQDHSNAERLLVLTVDIGEPTPRQVVAGIKSAYQAADLVGKLVVVVANLKPAMLRGIESQGMVLAASEGATMALVVLERPIAPGSQVK